MASGDARKDTPPRSVCHLGPVTVPPKVVRRGAPVVPCPVDCLQPLGVLGVEVGQLAEGGLRSTSRSSLVPLSPHELARRLEGVPQPHPVERLQRPQPVLPAPGGPRQVRGHRRRPPRPGGIAPRFTTSVARCSRSSESADSSSCQPAVTRPTGPPAQPLGHRGKGWPEALRPEQDGDRHALEGIGTAGQEIAARRQGLSALLARKIIGSLTKRLIVEFTRVAPISP